MEIQGKNMDEIDYKSKCRQTEERKLVKYLLNKQMLLVKQTISQYN